MRLVADSPADTERSLLTGSHQNSQHSGVLSSSHVVSDILEETSQGRMSTEEVGVWRTEAGVRGLTSPIMTASDGLQPSSDRACVETPARFSSQETCSLPAWRPAL